MPCLSQAVPAASGDLCRVDPALPAFEVASVKPVAPAARGYTSIGQYGSPRFILRSVSLRFLLSYTFDVQAADFVNAPRGLDDAVFDVQVEAANALPLSYETVRPRMRQLLQQRFCLHAHEGTRQEAGYALVVAKSGAKIKPVEAGTVRGSAYITQHEVNATGVTVNDFAVMLATPAGRPVQDLTRLPGVYNLKVQFAPPSDTDSPLPSIFTAVKEQLGLELKPAEVPVRTLIIDHLNLQPTEN